MKSNELIKNIRLTHQLSQQQFADLLGITQQAISNLEKGRVKVTIDMLLLICSKLNISLSLQLSPNSLTPLNSVTLQLLHHFITLSPSDQELILKLIQRL